MMEFDILYGIQNLHNDVLDRIMVFIFNDLVGSKGQIWIVLGAVLLLFRKTRKTGFCVLAAYGLSYLAGDLLKDWIARQRPCMVDDTVALLIARPGSFSCPSVHSMLAFASASAVFWFHRKTGIAVLIFAALVAFSRLYFFVHFPTDVLLGAVLGFVVGTAVSLCAKAVKRKEKART